MDRIYIEYEVCYNKYQEYVTKELKKPKDMLELFNKLVKLHSVRKDLQGLKILICEDVK